MIGSEPEHRRPAWHRLLPLGILELAFLSGLGWWPSGAAAWPRLLFFAAAFVVYAVAARETLEADGGGVVIWVMAVAMRLALLPLLPELSHDVYRYLWDGSVQLAGMNPYLHLPTDPALAQLRLPLHALIPGRGFTTPYPPLAEITFFAIALAGGAVFQAKLLWLGFDLGTAWLLGRVARLTGRSRRLTEILWLWSPLLLVEVAWNGHLEPLPIFGMVLVVLLARAPASAGASAGFSVLGGILPVAALPAFVVRLGRRVLLGLTLVLVALTAPYATAGRGLVTGLLTQVRDGRFQPGPFLLLESVLPGSWAPRVAAALVVVGVAAWVAARRFRPERALLWTVAAFLLVTPDLEPAFALWILPLAALRLNRTWLLMTGLVFLGYVGMGAHAATGLWPQPLWARLLLWVPLLALLARDASKMWLERFPQEVGLTERRRVPRE